jgi:hypothetical protein
MPIARGSLTVADGPLAQVRIGLSRAVQITRQQAGQTTPQPVTVAALIDTGAECTCVDQAIVNRLSLPLHTAGLTNVPGLGGLTGTLRYTAGVTLLHPSGKPGQHLIIPAIAVTALNLGSFGVEAVIGRDVLAQCILIYDGVAGTFAITY